MQLDSPIERVRRRVRKDKYILIEKEKTTESVREGERERERGRERDRDKNERGRKSSIRRQGRVCKTLTTSLCITPTDKSFAMEEIKNGIGKMSET